MLTYWSLVVSENRLYVATDSRTRPTWSTHRSHASVI